MLIVNTQIVKPSSSLTKFTWMWQSHTIQYTVAGTGKPLVLVHGFGASIGHWRQNVPVLAAGGYRVFAIDLLGFGGSDKPALDYSLDLWQDMLCDFWEANIKQPAVFVGNSIGALLCLTIAARSPQMADGLILVNAAGGLSHRPRELSFPLQVAMGVFTNLATSPAFGPLIFDRLRQRSSIRNTLQKVYQNQEAVTDELVELIYKPACAPGAQRVFASILSADPGPHPSELLPKVKCPLLVLWGEDDPWTPISGAKIYKSLSDRSEDVTFIPIPDAGHCPHDERPEATNALILDWLKRR